MFRFDLFAFSKYQLQFAVLALILVAQQAGARPPFLNQFNSLYPASQTSEAGCATCHAQAFGGPPWNAYGRDLRANGGQVGPNGDVTPALLAVELLNSDAAGGDNATEIAAGTQPGWCEPSVPDCDNSSYNADGSIAGGGTPPGGVELDDEIPPVPPTPPPSDGPVDLSGEVQTESGTQLCALVLASGQFQFTCNPNGPFSLPGLSRDSDGTVKRQTYVDGFFPRVDVLSDSANQTVVLQRAGACPDYNEPYAPGSNPGSAGDVITITGQVLLQNSDTPLCAIVLANGQFQFSCDGTGNYALDIPLDGNGHYKIQVYADGFAPKIQVFDEFQRVNAVRLARASECN